VCSVDDFFKRKGVAFGSILQPNPCPPPLFSLRSLRADMSCHIMPAKRTADMAEVVEEPHVGQREEEDEEVQDAVGLSAGAPQVVAPVLLVLVVVVRRGGRRHLWDRGAGAVADVGMAPRGAKGHSARRETASGWVGSQRGVCAGPGCSGKGGARGRRRSL
jgi:hypothetical protein